jgi:hypothetical protein
MPGDQSSNDLLKVLLQDFLPFDPIDPVDFPQVGKFLVSTFHLPLETHVRVLDALLGQPLYELSRAFIQFFARLLG